MNFKRKIRMRIRDAYERRFARMMWKHNRYRDAANAMRPVNPFFDLAMWVLKDA